MSVDYTHHCIPTRPLQRPSAERIARFIAAMGDEGWIPAKAVARGACRFASHVDAGRLPSKLTATWLRDRRAALRIVWSLEGSSRRPLTQPPANQGEHGWTLELHWSRHFLPTAAEDLGAPQSLACECGELLPRRPPVLTASCPFFQWVLTRCPTCRAPFDPAARSRTYSDPWTGAERALAGMGLHRFALQVACGTSYPSGPGRQPLRLHPALVELAERNLACTFHDDIGAFT